MPGAERAERQQDQGADGHRDGHPAAAGDGGARPGARHDVQRPERGRDQREHHPQRVEPAASAVAVGQAQGEDAEQGEHDPAAVAPAARQRGREGERAEELDRHRRAERQPGEGGVVEPVHPGQADPEEDDGPPLRPAPAAHPRPDDREQHDRGEAEAEQGGAHRAGDREQVRRQRRAELERRARPEHEQHRRLRPCLRSPGEGRGGWCGPGRGGGHASTVTDDRLVRPAMVFGQ